MMYTHFAFLGLLAVLLALGLDKRFQEDSYGRAAVLTDPSGTFLYPIAIHHTLTIGGEKTMLDITPLGGSGGGTVAFRDLTQTFWLTSEGGQDLELCRNGVYLHVREIELRDGDAIFFGPRAQLRFQYQ